MCQVSGPRSQALDFIAKFFLRPDTWNLRPLLCNHFPLIRLLTMRPKLSARLDSVSVECKSICLVQSQYSGDRVRIRFLRASSGSGVCVPFLFSPHEIGKSEELRELELPCVGR